MGSQVKINESRYKNQIIFLHNHLYVTWVESHIVMTLRQQLNESMTLQLFQPDIPKMKIVPKYSLYPIKTHLIHFGGSMASYCTKH
jgi:aromatic ring-cleaving dioxygenase